MMLRPAYKVTSAFPPIFTSERILMALFSSISTLYPFQANCSLRVFEDDRSVRMGRIRLPDRISDGYPATSKE
jgi:hypothetical protein